MPSPFPGMNPYLERAGVWRDFHDGLIQRLRIQLAPLVRPRYYVRVQDQLYFRESPDPAPRLFGYADIGVSTGRLDPPAGPPSPVAAPATVELDMLPEETTPLSLEVVGRDDERVVPSSNCSVRRTRPPGRTGLST